MYEGREQGGLVMAATARPVFGITPPPEPIYFLPDDLPLEENLTLLSVSDLSRRIGRLQRAAHRALELDCLSSIEGIELARMATKYALHLRTRTKQPRCHCGVYLAAVPDDQLMTDNGDNLDVWFCSRCGGEYKECY